ncbi:MAG: pitrilysin family protein [Candidatus Falkowbacteria bacterium]
MNDQLEELETFTLDNGLKVYYLHLPKSNAVYADFTFHSGSQDDPQSKAGLAHFVEHMINAASAMPSPKIINHFKNQGGDCELGSTGISSTNYNFQCLAAEKNLAEALSIFGRLLLDNPMNKGLNKEKKVVIQEFQRAFPDPERIGLLRQLGLLFRNGQLEPTDISGLGEPASINSFNYKDIIYFYRQHYSPSNLSLIVFGNLNADLTLTLIKQSPFGRQPSLAINRMPQLNLSYPAIEPTKIDYRYTTASLGYTRKIILDSSFPDRAKSITYLLIRSKLFDRLRIKERLCYSIISCWDRVARGNCYFSIGSSDLHLDAEDKIAGLVDDCLQEIMANETEYERTKRNFWLGQTLNDPSPNGLLKTLRGELINKTSTHKLKDWIAYQQAGTFAEVQQVIEKFQSSYAEIYSKPK